MPQGPWLRRKDVPGIAPWVKSIFGQGGTEPLPAFQLATWSTELMRNKPIAVPVLSVEKLTEFDPRLCHYCEGKWIER